VEPGVKLQMNFSIIVDSGPDWKAQVKKTKNEGDTE
jgi:hypothetical protein